MAEQAFIKNGINRVILATDGDFAKPFCYGKNQA
jgi:hypothetical protein